MSEQQVRPPRVGIVGGGQLAQMTYQAAIGLGVDVRVLAATPVDSAALYGADVVIGSPGDFTSLRDLAEGCDVVTFDHELIEPGHLAALETSGFRLRPSGRALAYAVDKLHQRAEFARLGLPVPPFQQVSGAADVAVFAADHGWPVVLKTARGGYDGRGVWVLDGPDEAAAVFEHLRGRTVFVEQFIPLERELAVIVARRPGGETAVYPVVETVQADGICHEVLVPAPVGAALVEQAADIARRVAAAIGVVGVMAVELFQNGHGLMVNEIACRPHNSGHYTIEGAVTSQFENHLRAVLDWPLGETTPLLPYAVMVNLLGGGPAVDPVHRLAEALAVPGVHVHLYRKGARPGRKLGHVTALGDDPDETAARARRAAAILGGEGRPG